MDSYLCWWRSMWVIQDETSQWRIEVEVVVPSGGVTDPVSRRMQEARALIICLASSKESGRK
eukprot:653179-Ditylum_brightwellii.AAC.1